MIAVVTGASGFIGRNLVHRLRRDGHEVRTLVRSPRAERVERTRSHVVDYGEPRSLLECPAFDGADAVFHLAAATRAVRRQQFVDANVTPTRHLLGALVARRLAPRVVLMSSQAAAGPALSPRQPVTEDDAPHPVEAYGASKLEAERVAHSFASRVPITILRPSSVFGPWDRDFLALFRFAERGVIPYPGVASHWLSVSHVDDVVRAVITAATSPAAAGRTYFVANMDPVRWRDFGDLVARAIGRSVLHVNVPTSLVRAAALVGDGWSLLRGRATLANRHKAALSRHPYWVCSTSRLREELGFTDARSLPEAVRDTYLWYLDRGWVRGSSRAARAAR